VTMDPVLVAATALSQVFDSAVVSSLRSDSVVWGAGSSLGMQSADAVAIADGIAALAARQGAECSLHDEDFYDMPEHAAGLTLADLTSVIERRWRELA
jgi:hypothetical protein